jgi:hypothetical protein
LTNNSSSQIKALILYALVTLILMAGVSLLPWINENNLTAFYYISQLLALVLGTVHAWLMGVFLSNMVKGKFWNGLWITLALMALTEIAVVIVYYFIKFPFPFITYIIPFIVPYLAWQALRYYAAIPPRVYRLWHYPVAQDIPDLDFIDLSQVVMVQFVLSKSPTDATISNFTSKAPLNMTLGQLFLILINDYNEKYPQSTVTYLKQGQKPYGWWFYKKKGLFKFKQFLDPALTFRDNGIVANDFIYATRDDESE